MAQFSIRNKLAIAISTLLIISLTATGYFTLSFLAANHPLIDLYASITVAKTSFILPSLAVLFGVLLLIHFSIKFLTDPLFIFTTHVQNISRKIGAERLIAITSDDEIGALSSAFNQMILELDAQKDALTLSENKYRGVFEAAHDAIFIETLQGDIIDANPAACKMLQYSREEIIGMNILQLLPEETIISASERMQLVLAVSDGPFITENRRKDGSRISLEIMSRDFTSGNSHYAVIIARDITERKQMERELRYLSQHDTLTAVYTRAFFEEEVQRLSKDEFAPIGMMICDIDGLKLVNDTLGHSAGDTLIKTAAAIIRSCFRENDIIARIGGDEFAVLLPHCTRQVLESTCQRISDAVFQYNLMHRGLPLSISVGYAVGAEHSNNISDLLREADDNMYREKLHHSQTARHALFQSILYEADEKDFRSGGHSDRLKELSEQLADRIQLPKSRIVALGRLAQYHDIGKVGISDHILFKPGPLTHEERAKMQRHSDIGRRIAQSMPDLSSIADLIWKHHEWWDGSGYPLGLQREGIPLECRILAIVEAYDAMTHNQPYRAAMTLDQAKAEIARCVGTQFDPGLTTQFLALLDERPAEQNEQRDSSAN